MLSCFRDLDADDKSDSDSSDYDKMEQDRLQDLQERDRFADRMREKDKDHTRKVMSKSEKKVGVKKINSSKGKNIRINCV